MANNMVMSSVTFWYDFHHRRKLTGKKH